MNPLHLLWIVPLTGLVSFCTGGVMTFGVMEDEADRERMKRAERETARSGSDSNGPKPEDEKTHEVVDMTYYLEKSVSGLLSED